MNDHLATAPIDPFMLLKKSGAIFSHLATVICQMGDSSRRLTCENFDLKRSLAELCPLQAELEWLKGDLDEVQTWAAVEKITAEEAKRALEEELSKRLEEAIVERDVKYRKLEQTQIFFLNIFEEAKAEFKDSVEYREALMDKVERNFDRGQRHMFRCLGTRFDDSASFI